jgi:hypothetical protein
MSTWLPSGQLRDGTLLFGPLRDKPIDGDPVLAVDLDGKTWWVKYCCKTLTPEQVAEVREWSQKRVAEYPQQAP